MNRQELHAAVKAMRERGMLYREIAAELSCSISHVNDVIVDPTGEQSRARKAKRSRPCVDCGRRVSNSGGEPPQRCLACAHAYKKATARWTHDTIIDAIQEWERQQGHPPTATEWNCGADDRRPSGTTVQNVFGSWNAAVAAAGFTPRGPGERLNTQARAQQALARQAEMVRLFEQGVDVRDIAGRVGYSTAAVRRRLRRSGVLPSRPRGRRFTVAEQTFIATRAGDGWSVAAISETLDRDHSSVLRFLRRTGVPYTRHPQGLAPRITDMGREEVGP